MDEKALYEAMMLNETDRTLLDGDLAKIAVMIERAAAAIDGTDGQPAKPDAAWQRIVPESDAAAQPEKADVVTAQHEIRQSGITVRDGVLTVPRVVG